MPRRKVIYTSEFPSHIVSRANNKDWFTVPIEECWEIYREKLNHISTVYEYSVHAFLLMSNHSHLIGTPSAKYDSGVVMNWLQSSVAREINRISGRTNHVFGDRYKASLITNPFYFAHATRYIYQNPLRAKICGRVQDYRFSTVHQELSENGNHSGLIVTPPDNGIDHLLTSMDANGKLSWYNTLLEAKDQKSVQCAFRKKEFAIAKPQGSSKDHWMKSKLWNL